MLLGFKLPAENGEQKSSLVDEEDVVNFSSFLVNHQKKPPAAQVLPVCNVDAIAALHDVFGVFAQSQFLLDSAEV